VSDCDAVQVMHDDIGYVPTAEDAVADALNAGVLDFLYPLASSLDSHYVFSYSSIVKSVINCFAPLSGQCMCMPCN
jgi:hypothetical protein